jgi:hypothetical protein
MNAVLVEESESNFSGETVLPSELVAAGRDGRVCFKPLSGAVILL